MRGDMHIIAGGPGAGKTIFAATFAANAVSQLKERVLYATFEESTEYFKKNLRSVGLDLEPLEKSGALGIVDLDAVKGKELESSVRMLLDAVRETRSTILIIDSLTALLLACGTDFELRSFMHTIYKSLRKENFTALLTVGQPTAAGFGVEAYVSDSVMLLENVMGQDQFKTRFIIMKMRGTEHSRKYHSVVFTPAITISRY
jgi:circadian clock protein KaiC